jgi:hypothetical protein
MRWDDFVEDFRETFQNHGISVFDASKEVSKQYY